MTNEEFTGLMQQYQTHLHSMPAIRCMSPHAANLTQDCPSSRRFRPSTGASPVITSSGSSGWQPTSSGYLKSAVMGAQGRYPRRRRTSAPEPRGVPNSDAADDPKAQSVIDRAGAAGWKRWCAMRGAYGGSRLLTFLQSIKRNSGSWLVNRPLSHDHQQ